MIKGEACSGGCTCLHVGGVDVRGEVLDVQDVMLCDEDTFGAGLVAYVACGIMIMIMVWRCCLQSRCGYSISTRDQVPEVAVEIPVWVSIFCFNHGVVD